ncbi:MAG: envelope stress response membrane protein PspC, partial [Sphingomonas sp.]
VRSKLRDVDRRLADMETHFTSRNTALADEIERLR